MEPKTRKETDDFLFKLQECFDVYDKKPNDAKVRVWLRAFRGVSVQDFCDGVDVHYTDDKDGKYMPRPANIRKLVNAARSQRRAQQTFDPEQGKESSPEVVKAWLTYMKFAMDFEAPGYSEHRLMDIDQAIEIVNQQAQEQMAKAETDAERLVISESILNKHKLPEYWV